LCVTLWSEQTTVKLGVEFEKFWACACTQSVQQSVVCCSGIWTHLHGIWRYSSLIALLNFLCDLGFPFFLE
jgi:hypothetical protein